MRLRGLHLYWPVFPECKMTSKFRSLIIIRVAKKKSKLVKIKKERIGR